MVITFQPLNTETDPTKKLAQLRMIVGEEGTWTGLIDDLKKIILRVKLRSKTWLSPFSHFTLKKIWLQSLRNKIVGDEDTWIGAIYDF